jgi:hypothetical protein
MRRWGVCGVWALLLAAFVYLAGTPAMLVAAAAPPTFVAAPGSPFATGGLESSEIVVNPAGTRLYVTNGISDNVTVFTLDASGTVTGQQPGSPFATGGSAPFGIAINPAGTRLYITNLGNNTVTVFILDASGNITAPQPGSPFATGGAAPEGVTINPAGTRLYVGNGGGGGNVTVFTLDGSGNITGQQPGSPFASGGNLPRVLTTNPAGTRLYATNNGSNNVTVFTLDASGNIAGTQPGSPFATGGASPFWIVTNPAGTRLYITGAASNTVTVLTLDASGDVTGTQPGSPFPTGGLAPVGAATGDFDGDGTPDLAVTNQSGTVTLFATDASGNLTGVMPSTGLTVGTLPESIIARDLNGDDRPDLAVVNSFSNNISVLFTTPAHAITATGGTPQSTIIGSAFATPLAATLTDLNNAGMAGSHVTFTVQPGGSGAAGTFASATGCVLSGGNLVATCLTDATGKATAPPLTANTHAGSFTVSANLPNNTLSAATFTLTNRTATLTVAGYPSPATVGTANPVTVTVIDQANQVGTTYTGTVQFTSTDPAATLPADFTFTAPDAGVHTFMATFGSVGTWTLTATDTVVGTITGQQAGITVDPANTTTALTISPFPAAHGSPVTLTATVAPATTTSLPTPTGSVTFSEGGTPLGTVTLVNGVATFTTSTLTVGIHHLTATYTPTSPGPYATSTGTGDATITAPPLVSIAVTPANGTLKVGQVQQYTATGTYADTTTADITSQVTWSSDASSVASVDASGKATGVSPGTAHITATQGGISGETTVTVSAGTAVGVAPVPQPASRPAGTTGEPSATPAPAPSGTGRGGTGGGTAPAAAPPGR